MSNKPKGHGRLTSGMRGRKVNGAGICALPDTPLVTLLTCVLRSNQSFASSTRCPSRCASFARCPTRCPDRWYLRLRFFCLRATQARGLLVPRAVVLCARRGWRGKPRSVHNLAIMVDQGPWPHGSSPTSTIYQARRPVVSLLSGTGPLPPPLSCSHNDRFLWRSHTTAR